MKKRISQFKSETAAAGFDQKTLEEMRIQKQNEAPPNTIVRTVQSPLVIMFRDPTDDKSVVCHIHPQEDDTYEHYGILICDLVRHVAGAFDVDESDVWQWVDAERFNPTDTVKQVS